MELNSMNKNEQQQCNPFLFLPSSRRRRAGIEVKRDLFVLVAVLWWGIALTGTAVAETIDIVDDLGNTIRLAVPAQRIISLYSAHTENLFSLGLDTKIIGVGRSAQYPPKALEKARFDYRSDPEKVIAANPDLVLIRPFIKRSYPQFIAVLERVGIPVVALYPEHFEDFDDYIRTIARLTGKERQAGLLLAEFHQQIDRIHKVTAEISPKVKVYFESVEKGYKTVIPDSLPARAIATAGGQNIVQDAKPIKQGSSIAIYGVEKLLEHAHEIDVFVVQKGAMNAGANVQAIAKRPGFHVIKAIKEGRVLVIDEKLISSPTFRYVEGIQKLVRMFYPSLISNTAW